MKKDLFEQLNTSLASHAAASFPAYGFTPKLPSLSPPKPKIPRPSIPKAPKPTTTASITTQNRRLDRQPSSTSAFEQSHKETERRRNQNTTNRPTGKVKQCYVLPPPKV